MPPDTITVGGVSYPAPGHLSHSAREQLLRCAKSFFLARMAKAPKRPALWLAGGSAVHEATEKYDRMSLVGQEDAFHVGMVWERLFGAHLDKLRKAEPNEWNWRRSASEPIERWNVMGPQFVQSYIDWRRRSPYTIWTTPDGTPAIELDVSGFLPGCPVEIKGYVDRIFHDPILDQLVDVDLKTGKRPPKTADQFGTYNALIEVKYGVRTPMGVPFMNRKATLGRPFELSEYTPESVGKVFGEAWDQIRRGDFPANGFDSECFLCDVSAACAAKGGPLAATYDPDSPGFELPPY